MFHPKLIYVQYNFKEISSVSLKNLILILESKLLMFYFLILVDCILPNKFHACDHLLSANLGIIWDQIQHEKGILHCKKQRFKAEPLEVETKAAPQRLQFRTLWVLILRVYDTDIELMWNKHPDDTMLISTLMIQWKIIEKAKRIERRWYQTRNLHYWKTKYYTINK